MTASNALARTGPGAELALPEGARQLGARVKPIIRLGMGIKDPERGFPRKTDYFTVRGDDRAAEKFTKTYGNTPKTVRIMVPSTLATALDISYRAFVGGQSEDGGRPLALGMTNFATLGYAGGPDVLRVWKGDGTYHEIETLGLDPTGKPLDGTARDLNIAIYATFTFTIPDVLGWGSFAQVTSKGKKSADNLTFKLSEIYSAFGSQAPWAFDREQPPMLVLKPDTALTRFEDKKTGESGWMKSKIFVLDIVIPEAFEDMRDRLLEHRREIAGQAPLLYSSQPPAIGAGAPAGEPGSRQQAGDAVEGTQTPPAAASPAPDSSGEPEPSLDDEHGCNSAEEVEGEVIDVDDEIAAAALAASQFHPPGGQYKHLSLSEILAVGERGESWIGWALRKGDTLTPTEYRQAVWAFARVYAPALYQAVLAKQEASA